MTSISPLANVLKKGLFGDHEDKNEDSLIKIKEIKNLLKDTDFAVTDLSHSRAVIELEGKNSKEILKKGCPFNFNEF